MNREKYILFMDSGIGGLSILNYFFSIKKDYNIIYYADTINFPYGKKSESKIGEILYNIFLNLSNDYNISLINIVCNTASVSALQILRDKVNIPIVGTVPAIKPATLITKNNKIGIIATETTVRSGYLDNLIKKFAFNKEVFVRSTPGLVELSEKGNFNNKIKNEIFFKELNYFKNINIDVLVLGSTHFSFLKNDIEVFFNNKVKVIDSQEGVTKRIIDLLPEDINLKSKSRILIISDKNSFDRYQYINKEFQLFNKTIIEDLSCQKV